MRRGRRQLVPGSRSAVAASTLQRSAMCKAHV